MAKFNCVVQRSPVQGKGTWVCDHLHVSKKQLGEEIRDVMMERDSGEGMVGERW